MRRFMNKFAGAIFTLAVSAAGASAADLAAGPYTKAPPAVAAAYDWSGFYIGGNGGGGVLDFRGRRYSLGIGGIDYGLVFGGSRTVLRGRVHNIWRPWDIAGAYAAGGAGIVVGAGVRGILLTNAKGVVLELAGSQIGLMANADLSGLAISMR